MGNYSSRKVQLESELKFMFNRLMNKKTIEKSDVMSVVNKFKDLKKEDPATYTGLANKAVSLNSSFTKVSFKGRVKPKEWEKLNIIYAEFHGLIAA
ncbi:MAG: hypothetical protein PHR61_04030 [Candidatus Absconditabacteria bacterium]|nr:hypothetical protein [Candidatus Absconditabacteria bacterium]